MRRSQHLGLSACAIIAGLCAGCSDDASSDTSEEAPFDASSILGNSAEDVITATYADLEDKAADLLTAVNELEADPTEARLDACRDAWRDARMPWEQSEAFLFGPVDASGFDPRLDTWPLNMVDMDDILAGSDDLDADFFAAANDDVKGFHAIERLLFGENGDVVEVESSADVLAELNGEPRRFEYLVGCCSDLLEAAESLHDAWRADGDNYQDNIGNPGSGKPYTSQKAAVLQLLDGMITIVDEVGSGKIATPFGPPSDITTVESRFSLNSREDFANNITGVRNVYLGNLGDHDGPGLDVFVASEDAALDLEIRDAMDEAIDAIESIPVTFEDAIDNARSDVQNAIDACLALRDLLDNDLRGLIDDATFE